MVLVRSLIRTSLSLLSINTNQEIQIRLILMDQVSGFFVDDWYR
jgi:hypothetical protein